MENTEKGEEVVAAEVAEVPEEPLEAEPVPEKEATQTDADKMDPSQEPEPIQNGDAPVEASTESTENEAPPDEENTKEPEKAVEPQPESIEPQRESIEPQRESVEPQRESVEHQREAIESERESIEPQREFIEPQNESIELAQEQSEEVAVRTTRSSKRKANDSDYNDNSKNAPSNETTGQKENGGLKKDDNVQKDSNSQVSIAENASLKPLSASEVMGKGKRARIPNKKYSDIVLSPNRRGLKAAFDTSDLEGGARSDLLEAASGGPSLPKRNRSSLPKENLQDPKYFKPFKYGWRRELVWRSTTSDTRKKGNIYYYTPSGKKVRTFRELSDHLTGKNLTLDNFSFTKELLGIDDPLKELSRDASYGKSDSRSGSETPPLPSKKAKKAVSPKNYDSDASKSDARQSAPSRRRTAGSSLAQISDNSEAETETSIRKAGKMSLRKGRAPPAKKSRLANKNEDSVEVETLPSAVRTSPRKTSKPCSIGCEGVQDIIPTLQCRICLCLYHHECVGLSPSMACPYVCKNCEDDGQAANGSSTVVVSPPPPLLTPIKALKSITSPVSTSLPKLQRIPRLDCADSIPLQSFPLEEERNGPGEPVATELPPTPKRSQEPSAEGCQSLVGAVTSWLPHNVKIVDSQQTTEAPRPQYVEYLAGRKFLVIPKHNFMSVSGSSVLRPEDSIVTPSALQPTEVPNSSASLGPDAPQGPASVNDTQRCVDEEVPAVKNEPVSPVRPADEEPVQAAGEDNEDYNRDKEALLGSKEEAEGACTGKDEASQRSRNLKVTSITNSSNSSGPDERNEAKFMENYMQNVSFGYNTLLHVFQYLKVQDLLRAGCVCAMWRDIASHHILWRTVRMKNSQVHSFEGLANALKKHGTVHLDLRKMLLPSTGDDIWPEFSKAISRVDTLRKIELCRCPSSVVEELTTSNPYLEVINAVTIKCESLNLDPFNALKCIRELKLKSTCGLSIKSIDSLKGLKTLKILSLTSVTDLHKLDLTVMAELVNLEALDLGECTDFPKSFGSGILLKLHRLEKLRLEKGQGSCHTFDILEAVKDMERLEQLELVNFDVKTGFDKAIGLCRNIKKLMVIPTYISQSATTNNMVLSGVLQLHGNLSHFVWGVTLELLRVTELFVDQCEDSNKKEKKPGGNGDCIPVLKPVPDLSNGGALQAASNPPQVEILPLPNLQKLLLNSLPTTRVKILKIPFHATWRQTLSDTV